MLSGAMSLYWQYVGVPSESISDYVTSVPICSLAMSTKLDVYVVMPCHVFIVRDTPCKTLPAKVKLYWNFGFYVKLFQDGDVLVQTLNSSERMDLPSSSSAMEHTNKWRYNHRHHHSHRVHKGRKKASTKTERFNKTAAVLQKAGLMEIALQTAQIMEENSQLERDIKALKEETEQYTKTLEKKLQGLSWTLKEV